MKERSCSFFILFFSRSAYCFSQFIKLACNLFHSFYSLLILLSFYPEYRANRRYNPEKKFYLSRVIFQGLSSYIASYSNFFLTRKLIDIYYVCCTENCDRDFSHHYDSLGKKSQLQWNIYVYRANEA